MVMYAWAVAQDYFVEMTDQNVREELYEKDKRQLEEDMSPFGFIVDGLDDDIEIDTKAGLIWHSANEYNRDTRFDLYKDRVTDYDMGNLEYGLPSSDWEWG